MTRTPLAASLRLGVCCLLVLSSVLPAALADWNWKGRPLVEVLRELGEQGLRIVYSSAVVPPDLLVTVEPDAAEPRAALEAVLAPLGLAARTGPAGPILIVRPEAAAERPGLLRGRVLSGSRRSPVARASVHVEGTSAHGETRPDGTFRLEAVPAGVYDLTIEAHGFVTATAPSVHVTAGRATEVSVSLEPQPGFVEQVVVTPSNRALLHEDLPARRSVSLGEAALTPSVGDVSRIVELLPGVAGADNSAQFNLRGSAARDVSFILDGLELYAPYHLQFFQSPFTVIDASGVDRIDLLGGGWTADYGDRHGGFVELASGPAHDPYTTRLEAGSLNSRIEHRGSTRWGDYQASARAWYPDAGRETTELGEKGMDPRFGDLSARFSFGVSDRTTVSAHALAGTDDIDFLEPGGNESVKTSNNSAYLWVRPQTSWSERLSTDSVISAGRLERRRRGISEPEDALVHVDDTRTLTFFGLKSDLNWEIAPSQLFRAGVDARTQQADYGYRLEDEGDPTASRRAELDPHGASVGAYVSHRLGPAPSLTLEYGFRWDRQGWTGESEWSPRLNAAWRPGQRTEVRFAAGRYHQSQRIHELRVEDGETAYRPAEASRQVDLTVEHRLAGGLLLRADLYDRRLASLSPRYENLFNPVELYPETEADRVLVDPQSAHLRGIELLVHSAPERVLTWWGGYALSSADDRIDGHLEPRSWDQTHAFKFLVGATPGPWAISLSGSAHTGWPTTPMGAKLAPAPGGGQEAVADPGERNSDRFPWYLRFDLKGSRTFEVGRGRLRLELELLNLTNRENVCCLDEFVFHTNAQGKARVDETRDDWLGFTPTGRLVWEF